MGVLFPQPEFVAEITELSGDGAGVAHVDGKAVIVSGALPGERVRLRISRRTRGGDQATVLHVDRSSPSRVIPRCEHFSKCGGCALQHLAPDCQVTFKQEQMLTALQRIGGVVPGEVAPAITGPLWSYRRRARLGVNRRLTREDGCEARVRVGFRQRGRPLLMRLRRCEILDHRVGSGLTALAEVLEALEIRECIPQIEVATTETAVALVLRVLRTPTEEDCRRLCTYAQAQGYTLYLQTGGPGSIIPLWPPRPPPLEYSPDGSSISLVFGPTDFVQVNAATSQAMVRQALDWLDPVPGEHALDLFAGSGNFSFPLAAAGVTVTALEGDKLLVARGHDNVARNHLKVDFVQTDLFKPSAQESWFQAPVDLVLLDPPRVGAQEVLSLVAKRRPRRVLYVSCNPSSLARDARMLVYGHGYYLRRAGVVDMFPHTAHVESMALFEGH